jgi:nicotinate-nucleotide adenylyltransferase
VVDGNYDEVRDLVWSRATDIVWLDLSLPRVLWRLLRRTVKRAGQPLWNGNSESFRSVFFQRDSLLAYTLRSYQSRRRSLTEWLARPEFAHLRISRFRSPQALAKWLAESAGASPVKARIGIFGGTFDPIHNIHLEIARAALEQGELDRVLFMVSARPPHKRTRECASPEDRYAMVAAALVHEPGMQPSRMEIDREGPSYTVLTLRQLRQEYPEAELYLILGVDALADLPKWKESEAILKMAKILAVPRPGHYVIPAELGGHYRMLEFPEAPVSSTEVRHRIAEGEPLDTLVPWGVRQYILEKDLYDVCTRDGSR